MTQRTVVQEIEEVIANLPEMERGNVETVIATLRTLLAISPVPTALAVGLIGAELSAAAGGESAEQWVPIPDSWTKMLRKTPGATTIGQWESIVVDENGKEVPGAYRFCRLVEGKPDDPD